jgi:type I restriction enzyme S subunit
VTVEVEGGPWPVRPLGETCEILDRLRRPVNAAERSGRLGPYPYYGANGQVGTIDEYIFNEELVLVAEDGGFFFDPLRPIAYRVSGKCWVNNHAHVLRASEGVDPDWLCYAVAFQDVSHLVKGATRPKLNQKELREIPVPVPPLGEQQRVIHRIKDCLRRVDEVHSLRLEADREARALLPSALASVFHDLAETYDPRPLETLVSDTRYGTSQKCNADSRATPVLRIPNVADGKVSFDDLKYCELEPDELGRLALQGGDILIVRTNGSPDLVGRCAVFEAADRPFAYASYLIRLRINHAADPHFIAFYLASTHGRDAIAEIRRTSAGQYNINSENLRAIRIPLPPVGEQQRVADRLRQQQDIVHAIAAEQVARLDEAGHLRTAVLRKAFAGEL